MNKRTSTFETVQGVQGFIAVSDVTSVDHPSLGLPFGTRQLLVQTKVERAVGNQVRQHVHPRIGRGVDQRRRDLRGNGGDESHLSTVRNRRRG